MREALKLALVGTGSGPDLYSIFNMLSCPDSQIRELGTTPWLALYGQIDGQRQEVLAKLDRLLGSAPVDRAVLPAEQRAKKLVVCDMDSTIIEQECLDELAEQAGLGRAIAELTEQAMSGELSFVESFSRRISMLAGLPLAAIGTCLAERIKIRPLARQFVLAMKEQGARTVLLTGGLDMFAQPIAAACGFDAFYANKTGHDGERLLGQVVAPVLDATGKLRLLQQEIEQMGISPDQSLAIGDGANDILMLQAAGLGLSMFGKEQLEAHADAAIRHGGFASALFFQGLELGSTCSDR